MGNPRVQQVTVRRRSKSTELHASATEGRRTWNVVRLLSAILAFAVVGLVGCNGWWDDVRSRDFTMASIWEKDPDPFEILKTSKDGDKRERAYRALGERNLSNASAEEKEYVLTLLSAGAMKEQQVWARFAAVESLGNFKEKIAVKGLEEAYYRANSFSPKHATMLKAQILTSLGRTEQPDAIELLTKVLKEPPVEGSNFEEQQRMDERIAAARALGKFPYIEATEPLVETLRHEKDVALRNNAHRSLQSITERSDIPADAQAWADYVQKTERGETVPVQQNAPGLNLSDIVPVKFFQSN